MAPALSLTRPQPIAGGMNLEPEAVAQAVTGMDNEEWMATQEATLRAIVGSGDFPHFKRILSMDVDLDLDALFERGLRYLLDGLAVALDTSNRGANGPL